MGRDIHAFVEYRYCDELRGWQWWQTLAQNVDISRDLYLFDVLAGMGRVHDAVVTPIAFPRGLPSDVSEHVAIAAAEWGQDGHSHSYLIFEELVQAQKTYSAIDVNRIHHLPTYAPVPPDQRLLHFEDDVAVVQDVVASKMGPNRDLAAIIAYLQVYEQHGYRTRMSFWFDN